MSPQLTALPGQCAFADRCPDRFDRCTRAAPDLYPVPGGGLARCFAHAAR